MSVLAPVEFSTVELKKLALKTGGAIVWGGSLRLAPADDVFIGVEHPLRIDPEPQMIASIMAKKLAVGTDFMVLDLPVGNEVAESSGSIMFDQAENRLHFQRALLKS
jgi:AMP phosphorylase